MAESIKVGNREIMLCEYNGHYRIETGRMGQDREGNPRWWPDRVREYLWNKDTKTRNLSEKDGNCKIPLGGSKEEAERALIYLLRDLTGELYVRESEAKSNADDAPF